ncbi:MAG: replicative DNA helicase [Flavobacteriaceae bacterium]|nr:replicative DNA helicase [Flavobacteriaceae bacterium]
MQEESLKLVNIAKGSDVVSLRKGKIPPHAVELEAVILGAIMIDTKGIEDTIDILRPEMFYKESHQHIYTAVCNLFQAPNPIDILSVSAELKRMGKLEACGGDFYLIQLSQQVASSAHIEYHARIVQQKYIQRSLITISSEIIELAYEDGADVFELIDQAESKIYTVSQGNINRGSEIASSLVTQAKKRIEEIASKTGMSGIPSGFEKIDNITGGWQPSDLVIIAARPGMGKTAFVLSMARNIAINAQVPIAVFSLEMASVQLITRMISTETGLTSDVLRKGNLKDYEWEQLNTKVRDLERAPIFIDDTPMLSISDLRAKARRLKSQHDIKIVVIDYLQLMHATPGNKNTNREQEISTISRGLKALAKELDIPVIALSQLSREVEKRGGPSGSKRPLLSDLRESGAIEQDADIVSFIYRPEYYRLTEWDDEAQSPTENEAEFIIAKHRNGSLDNIRLRFVKDLGKFENLNKTKFDSEINSKMNAFEDSYGSTSPNTPTNPNDAFYNNQDNTDENDDGLEF